MSSWGGECGRGHPSFKSRQEEVGSYLCSSGQCWEELCEGGDMSWLAMNLLAGGSELREDICRHLQFSGSPGGHPLRGHWPTKFQSRVSQQMLFAPDKSPADRPL